MKFYNSFNPPPSMAEVQCPFELQDYIYNSKTMKLEPTKKIPLYKEIQSFHESTKLSTKLTAYSMGDFSSLGFESDSYFDVSGQESNLANVLNTQQVAEKEFERLPNELKSIFHGDFTEFVKCINDNTLESRITSYIRGKNGGIANPSPIDTNNKSNKGDE